MSFSLSIQMSLLRKILVNERGPIEEVNSSAGNEPLAFQSTIQVEAEGSLSVLYVTCILLVLRTCAETAECSKFIHCIS